MTKQAEYVVNPLKLTSSLIDCTVPQKISTFWPFGGHKNIAISLGLLLKTSRPWQFTAYSDSLSFTFLFSKFYWVRDHFLSCRWPQAIIFQDLFSFSLSHRSLLLKATKKRRRKYILLRHAAWFTAPRMALCIHELSARCWAYKGFWDRFQTIPSS